MLKKTREAIVEELDNSLILFNINHGQARMKGGWISYEDTRKMLTQALKDYTQKIVEMVEEMGEDVVAPDREPPYRVDYVNKSRLLEELNK